MKYLIPTFVLLVLTMAFGFLMTRREEVQSTVLRVPGQLFQKNDDGTIGNLYNIQLVNKTFEEKKIHLELKTEFDGAVLELIGETDLLLDPQESTEGVFFVKIPAEELGKMKSKIQIEIYEGDKLISKETTSFISPSK